MTTIPCHLTTRQRHMTTRQCHSAPKVCHLTTIPCHMTTRQCQGASRACQGAPKRIQSASRNFRTLKTFQHILPTYLPRHFTSSLTISIWRRIEARPPVCCSAAASAVASRARMPSLLVSTNLQFFIAALAARGRAYRYADPQLTGTPKHHFGLCLNVQHKILLNHEQTNTKRCSHAQNDLWGI